MDNRVTKQQPNTMVRRDGVIPYGVKSQLVSMTQSRLARSVCWTFCVLWEMYSQEEALEALLTDLKSTCYPYPPPAPNFSPYVLIE
jgi:hypothetical protein